jgi:hypothetical protein
MPLLRTRNERQQKFLEPLTFSQIQPAQMNSHLIPAAQPYNTARANNWFHPLR